METLVPEQHKRLDVVDALRGFALLAIVLLHCLEHYNLYYFPDFYPDWLKDADKTVWDATFFLLAGKAYATFSLLFGFSFFIQYSNEERRGGDFRWRFAWRMFLLFLFSQFHALFYNGDILFLYSVVGMLLIPVCRLKDKTVLIIATLLLLQPVEWGRLIYGIFNPECETYGNYFKIFASHVKPLMIDGTFWELTKANIGYGQLYSNCWQVENGRLFQTAALFMFGMLLGRRKYFVKSEESIVFWKQILRYSVIAFIPLYIIKVYVPECIESPAIKLPFEVAVPSIANFSFMCILVSAFTLLWFKKDGYKAQRFIIPYGRMTLTNYIVQSIIGCVIFYGYGFALYQYTGAIASMSVGGVVFIAQLLFSKWWLSKHRQGPFEYIWRRGTWLGRK